MYGSKHFVASLGKVGEPKKEDIALDLNFDMVVRAYIAQLYIFIHNI